MVRVIFDDLCICGAKRLDDPSSVDPPLGHLEQRVLTVEHAIEARAYFLHVPDCLPIRIGQVFQTGFRLQSLHEVAVNQVSSDIRWPV